MDAPTQTPRLRKLAIGLSVLLVVTELASFGFVKFFLQRRYKQFFHYDFTGYVDEVPDAWVEKFRETFDPELGWNTVANQEGGTTKNGCNGRPWRFTMDSIGSREAPHDAADTLISLYGGSYTFGAEVNNDETWQYFLAKLADTRVLNFGVGGFGPDQALFKMRRNLAAGIHTPIVVVGLYSSGIRRTVNTYRPFLTLRDVGLELGFKPYLIEEGGEYLWHETALHSLDDRSEFPRALERAKEHDLWYALNEKKPTVRFPYTYTLAKTIAFVLRDYAPTRNLWRNERAAGNISELIREFVALSEEYDFVPVVAFLPELGELDGYDEGKPSYYADYYAALQERYAGGELLLVDVYAQDLDPKKFAEPGCHPSAYGNEVIAGAVHAAIADVVADLKAAR